ncbi:MAG: hypothetical protein NC206_09615 [Bacteroides sp.]|nr:hypothetical protein [Roseburia sp.]MCM1347326.1 hypothetical protein [Bacteroides sp.]MCM1421806.1 hypothetical protein [Bacteroides sp.]
MDCKYSISEIERLVNLFMDGDTSLEEERLLYDFFTHEDIPDSLLEYKDLFADFAAIGHDNASVYDDTDLVCVQAESPVHSVRNLKKWAIAVAASISVVFGTYVVSDWYKEQQLSRLYGGSYMVVNGVRIDNLKKIQSDIESVLSHADEIEKEMMTGKRIRMAEQAVLNGIADESERERIRCILEE